MGRTGSHNPERIRTPALDRARALLRNVPAADLPIIRSLLARQRPEAVGELIVLAMAMSEEERSITAGLAADKLAGLAACCDEPRRRKASRRNWVIDALHEADLSLREAVGQPLRQTDQYRDHRPAGGPSLATVYAEFGDWETALRDSGLLDLRRPEAHLVRLPGSPRPACAPDLDTRIAAVALIMDRCFRGRRFSNEAYNDARENLGGDLPSYNQVIGAGREKKDRLRWDQALDLAVELILAHPASYPAAHAYITRCREVRGAESA